MSTNRSVTTSYTWTWVAYAASLWAILFALISFYWAAGGMIGIETLGTGIEDLARTRDSEIIAVTWVTGILKLIAALCPVALVRRWDRFISRRLLLLGTWAAGLIFLVYGIINVVQHGLMAIGINPVAQMIGIMSAVYWHLFFWDPVWLIGGVLFLLTARHYGSAKHW
jgi:hypothetical protein